MDDKKSNAIDIRGWEPPKFIAGMIECCSSTVVNMVDDGRLQGAVVGGKKRRTIMVNPKSAEMWMKEKKKAHRR